MEICAINGEEIELPTVLIENENVFKEVLNFTTWQNVLTQQEKQDMMQLLPTAKEEDEDREGIVKSLLQGENFKFGNPVQEFQHKLRAGYYAPEVRKYHVMCQNVKKKEFEEYLRKYYKTLLIDALKSRQHLVQHVRNSAPDEPLKKRRKQNHIDKVICSNRLSATVQKRYKSILSDCFKECNLNESEFDDDDVTQNTFDGNNENKNNNLTNGNDHMAHELDATYNRMLYKQKRRNRQEPDRRKPTSSIAEIFMRTYPSYKIYEINGILPVKEKVIRKRKSKNSSLHANGEVQVPKTCSNYFGLIRNIFKGLPERRGSTKTIEERIVAWQKSGKRMDDNADWVTQVDDWSELVTSGLRYLSADAGSVSSVAPIPGFVPYVDFRERMQQWKWTGSKRDSDEILEPFCQHWFDTRDDEMETVNPLANLPLPGSQTEYIVKPSSDIDKEAFRNQEQVRYSNPHRAFTYRMHDYDSVVGPVKGIYEKQISASSKAREHALLKQDRPPFVTILTIARDAAARLPNGEGTRADICELLKDSQYLVECSDSQINSVVSGALDRLHYEKDPCVKYDSSRKLWVYLHRNRTEEEFERIHNTQAAAYQAKKGVTKSKAPKLQKSTADKSFSLQPRNEFTDVDNVSKDENASDASSDEKLYASPISSQKSRSIDDQLSEDLVVKSTASSAGTKTKLIISNTKTSESSVKSEFPSEQNSSPYENHDETDLLPDGSISSKVSENDSDSLSDAEDYLDGSDDVMMSLDDEQF